jgi:hypothetical protein
MTNKTKTVTIYEIIISTAISSKLVTRKSEKAARALVAKAQQGDNFRSAHITRVVYEREGTTSTVVLNIER